jgi:general secretion pathway protein K
MTLHRPLSNSKGMAVLLTISLISVLAIVTLQFNREMRQQYIVSAGLKNNILLIEMAQSGITIAEQILLQDREDNNFDSLHDSWALLGDEDLTTLFDQGSLKIVIADESGKFQINAMLHRKKEGQPPETEEDAKKIEQREHDVRNILWRLLRAEPYLVEDGIAREIIDSLIDWIDSDDGDGEEEYGAEDSYYQSLDPPYSCKNGPVESIEELLLVKGITPEILYGNEEKPALAPLLTPFGDDGKININTAELSLLQAIAQDLDKKIAEDMISFREEELNKEKLSDQQWYKENIPSFPGDIADRMKEQDLTTVASIFFTIKAATEFNTQQKTITATVKRSDRELSILRWDNE